MVIGVITAGRGGAHGVGGCAGGMLRDPARGPFPPHHPLCGPPSLSSAWDHLFPHPPLPISSPEKDLPGGSQARDEKPPHPQLLTTPRPRPARRRLGQRGLRRSGQDLPRPGAREPPLRYGRIINTVWNVFTLLPLVNFHTRAAPGTLPRAPRPVVPIYGREAPSLERAFFSFLFF